ncbi:MAG: aminomethyl-transferring glycine dehydrogenase subunit GcvPA [Candidatus Heimdallarchaeota archaeon]|nr:aminomethyl-transferring glycine dehydrogenase subunit GcvPA [Candidatus Heimdallarchaeota archaeon]
MVSTEDFIHPFLPQTKEQIEAMLKIINISSIEDLYSGIPSNLRFQGNLGIPNSQSEQETLQIIKKILSKNKSSNEINSFLGAGVYPHFIPSAVPSIINRSEFITSYTPYAPEVSQGMLQALWEYQSMIANLTKLELVNSSMYDMTTSLGEAALMCTRATRKKIFLVPSYLQPERFQTLQTYAQGPDISIKTYSYDQETGRADIDSITKLIKSSKGNISGIYLENPNFWGIIEKDAEKIGNMAHDLGGLFVVGVDPISLGVLKSPGDYGADIAIGEGQSLGLPMNFGGPLLGLFAVKNDLKLSRAMPGRIIGLTTEKNSNDRAFTMTLQTREQHIRREKATSNICTNNALCAVASSIFLSLIGPNGLKKLAETCIARTNYLMEELDSVNGISSPNFTGSILKEFVFNIDEKISSKELEKHLQKNNIQIGFSLQPHFPELGQSFLSAATEMITDYEIEKTVSLIRDFLNKKGGK